MIFDNLVDDLNRKMKEIELTSHDTKPIRVQCEYNNSIPDYNPRDYAIIANQEINTLVILPASRKNIEGKYFISTINKIPRNIQQRIGSGSASSWLNMVMIYNFFADELGYSKITMKEHKIKKLRMYDAKEKTGMDCGLENMVYMSDGVYIHKNDCWW